MQHLHKKAWKKFGTSTGLEPVTSGYRCDALTNWAMKPLTLGPGQLWVHMFPWNRWIYSYYRVVENRANQNMGDGNSNKACFGRKTNSSGNLEILPEIRRLRNFSGKYEIVIEIAEKKKQSMTFLQECHQKKGHIVAHCVFKTMFVRVVSPPPPPPPLPLPGNMHKICRACAFNREFHWTSLLPIMHCDDGIWVACQSFGDL